MCRGQKHGQLCIRVVIRRLYIALKRVFLRLSESQFVSLHLDYYRYNSSYLVSSFSSLLLFNLKGSFLNNSLPKTSLEITKAEFKENTDGSYAVVDYLISDTDLRFASVVDTTMITSPNQKIDSIVILCISCSVFTLLLSCIVLVMLRKMQERYRKERVILEQDKAEILSHFKINLIQKFEGEKRIDDFQQQITLKNELIEELQFNIREATGEIFLNEREQLIKELSKLKILKESDWATFQKLFSKVHSGLIEKLLSKHPDLTEAELRQLLLIKLKFSTKLNAEILGISVESVRKSRYRLKKKLGLNGEDLNRYIENFS